ncbi:MAG: glycosyltransferase family 4 protein [Chloroflexi bacterium]|nr:glycosyltransferase family 4 protein [Chloroflexota bacterium]
MRVLMISKALIVGAYQKKAEELARMADVQLSVVVPPYWRDGRQRTYLERAHLVGYELIVEKILFNGHFHLHFYPGLKRHFQRLQPDIVHIEEEPYNLATWHALRLAKRRGARSLFFTWQNIYRRLPFPFNLFEHYNYSQADYAIAGNEAAKDVLRRKGFGKPIAVIPQFGVDPSLYEREGLELTCRPADQQGRPFIIGYIGRIVPQKGLLSLLRAAVGLAGQWQLILIGEGDFRARLEKETAELGITDRLIFKGPVPSVEVPRYLTGFDVLVLPSLTTPSWKEQFGRVLIEAMACEVPVIGSDSGEIPNVIGDAGLIFPEGDVERLRSCLRRVREDDVLRGRLARLGRQRVLDHYTQARIAQETYRVYAEMLA